MKPPTTLTPKPAGSPPDGAHDAHLRLPSYLQDVEIRLEARLGEFEITVADLARLKSGSVFKLEQSLSDPIELRLNGSIVARGEIVAVDDHFAVKIIDVADLK